MTDNHEEFDEFRRYEFLAENGHPTFQYFFASAINAQNNFPNRQIQALKWANLAHYFGEPQAEDVIMFLRHSMNEEQIENADRLVEEWISKKFEVVDEKEKKDWSQNLQKMIAGNEFKEQ